MNIRANVNVEMCDGKYHKFCLRSFQPPEQLEGHATQFARLDSKILTLTRKRPAEDDVPDSREKQPEYAFDFLYILLDSRIKITICFCY